MNTYSGVVFSPLEPTADDININDIAHALSLMCRGNGHTTYFFSVAQHSINCALEAKARGYTRRVQLALLLHDASEAYLADIIRPVKKYIEEYYTIEKNLQDVIYKKYLKEQITDEEREFVRIVDDEILLWELDSLISIDVENLPTLSHQLLICERNMKDVENEFLELFNKLSQYKL